MLHSQTSRTKPFPTLQSNWYSQHVNILVANGAPVGLSSESLAFAASIESKNTLSDVEEGTSLDNQSTDGTSLV